MSQYGQSEFDQLCKNTCQNRNDDKRIAHFDLINSFSAYSSIFYDLCHSFYTKISFCIIIYFIVEYRRFNSHSIFYMNEELKFISLAEAAKITNYSQDYISLLCRQGKLRAQKLGRNWVTTKEWVQSYVDNSNGTGVSIIPVKVQGEKIEEVIEKIEKARKGFVIGDFYGKPVLQFALFCFFSILIFCNFYAFAYQMEAMKYDKLFEGNVAHADNIGSVAGVSSERESVDLLKRENSQDFEMIEIIGDLSEKDKEGLQRKIQEGFLEEIDVEIFDGYAVVSYKNNPEKRFLYVEK